MSKASFQTSPSKALPTAITTEAPLPERAKPKSRKTPLRRFIEALASLKLTVALLAMSVVLVFCGTLRNSITASGRWSTAISAPFLC